MSTVRVGVSENNVESNTLNNWKLNIFQIIDKRISFYFNNPDLLPPKPKFSFRHLKQGIQEFHRKFVLVPADKATNNVVIVWRLHYVNTLIQELGSTNTYERTSSDEKYVVNSHCCHISRNIFIRFGTKVYRQTIGIPMGTNCAPLVVDLFLLCYERYFMKSLSQENQADIIEAFNSTLMIY